MTALDENWHLKTVKFAGFNQAALGTIACVLRCMKNIAFGVLRFTNTPYKIYPLQPNTHATCSVLLFYAPNTTLRRDNWLKSLIGNKGYRHRYFLDNISLIFLALCKTRSINTVSLSVAEKKIK